MHRHGHQGNHPRVSGRAKLVTICMMNTSILVHHIKAQSLICPPSSSTNRSMWIQSDEEWNSDSPRLIEKFLCVWSNLSYLHVSWETYDDLVNCIGASAKVRDNEKAIPLAK